MYLKNTGFDDGYESNINYYQLPTLLILIVGNVKQVILL